MKGRIKKGILIIILIFACLSLFAEDFKCLKKEKTGWEPAAVIKALLNYYNINTSQNEIMKKIKENKKVPVYKIVKFIREKGVEPVSFKGDIKMLDFLVGKGIPVVVLQQASEKLKKNYLRIIVKKKKNAYFLCEPCAGKIVKLKKDKLIDLWEGGKYWGLIIEKDGVKVNKDEYYYMDKAFLSIYEGNHEKAKELLKKALELKEDLMYKKALDCINKNDNGCLKEVLKKSPHVELINKKEEDDFISSFFVSLFL